MSARRYVASGGALFFVAACGAPTERQPEPLGTVAESIVGGTVDGDDPAAIAIFDEMLGLTLCSGALVGPRTVLTAGHCSFPTAKLSIRFGQDVKAATRTALVVAQKTHPKYTAEGAPYDFALLELDAPVTDVVPLALRTAPLTTADVGTLIRHVGFGIANETSGAGLGTKRTVTYPITSVQDDIFYSGAPGEQTCDMDSGAPGLVRDGDGVERIAGVVSDGPNCHEDGWDGRADLADLASFVTATRADWESTPVAASGGSGCAVSTESRTNAASDRLSAAWLLGAFAAAFATIFRRGDRRTRDRILRRRRPQL